MEIKPFDELKITTITLVITLSTKVNNILAYHLLPITKIRCPSFRDKVKCKIPYSEIPGAILSMSCAGQTRGIVKSKSNTFKNVVMIDISTSKKNISMKLSAQSIQMCGASSRNDGIEAAEFLIEGINKIQKVLEKIHDDREYAEKTINHLKTITKGEPTTKNYVEQKMQGNGVTINIHKDEDDFFIEKVDITKKYCDDNDIDYDIAHMLIASGDGFVFHSDLCYKFDYIMSHEKIIDEELKIDNVAEAMVNYNYMLGFKVDRQSLNQIIDGKNGFVSRFNNALTPSVAVELPYEPGNNKGFKRKKNKVPHHTFLVYKSGSVTQSGPGGKIMEDAYYLFMETLSEIKDSIQYIDV